MGGLVMVSAMSASGKESTIGASDMESGTGTLGIEWDMCASVTVLAVGASRMDWKVECMLHATLAG